ncbi:MAG TPA: glycosyltransferase [Gemmatimonadota bacterium]|nr:glycosyltransferase [Gemmatimonadota bacterium]
MRILLVTPSADAEAPGNRVTADRWAGFLRELGHEAEVAGAYPGAEGGARPDVLVALHARKSLPSVVRYDEERGSGRAPRGGLVVALTGTDLYRDLADSDAAAWDAVRRADRLVVLQERGPDEMPPELRERTRVIYQSVPELWDGGAAAGDVPGAGGEDGEAADGPAAPDADAAGSAGEEALHVCMLAHLRPVKDPLLAAEAAALLPEGSRVRIDHYGSAYSEEVARRAREASPPGSRYRWHGEIGRPEALRRLAASDLLLLTSKLEGAGNAASEAITAGVPVLCTDVSGLVGMVGRGYPGLFGVGDARALARLLRRAETDPGFVRRLRRHVEQRRPLLDPARERDAWRDLLQRLDLSEV